MSLLRKSKLLSSIALQRVGDYLDLLKIEVRIRQHDTAVKAIGFTIAGLCGLLFLIFLGLAIIVSFWDSPYRVLSAWCVVAVYAAIAGISVAICLRHFRPQSIASSLRTEIRNDIALFKESL